MDQTTLGRKLLRFRHLVTRALRHRLLLNSAPTPDAFISELHRLHKKAALILMETTLELEADLKRVNETDKNAGKVSEYRHWLAAVGSCCETFVEFAFRSCDVHHLYKGHGSVHWTSKMCSRPSRLLKKSINLRICLRSRWTLRASPALVMCCALNVPLMVGERQL